MSRKGTTLSLKELTDRYLEDEETQRQGGGAAGQSRQRRLARMTARERLAVLHDEGTPFHEIGLFAAYGMYEEWGGLPAAGVLCGVATVAGHPCMVIANDATVKAGAFFPQTVKKVLRAQRIAYQCRLPIIYLVDSSGVFLPLQDEIFPDEDDFGRIFRNNAVLSAQGIPQFAAIMGNCIAGGAYLPVLCDKLLMTKGSGLYLAGPALVKAAIGQECDTEELGGAQMHAAVSGTVDFLEEDDAACLFRLRQLVAMLPATAPCRMDNAAAAPPRRRADALYELMAGDNSNSYDVRELLDCIIDADSGCEYKKEYGQALVCLYARIDGIPTAIVANQRHSFTTGRGQLELGGVLYADSADKAARFVMDCNQSRLPIVFLQDVVGFMVGKEAEQTGIIRCGAKLVNAISNSVVPKLTMLIGHSFGAGHYALCGKAYDPLFIGAWPNAQYAVMGAEQAADTLLSVKEKTAARHGTPLTAQQRQSLKEEMTQRYRQTLDIRYAAARGWVDAIIAPDKTRETLSFWLQMAQRAPLPAAASFHTGVIQV